MFIMSSYKKILDEEYQKYKSKVEEESQNPPTSKYRKQIYDHHQKCFNCITKVIFALSIFENNATISSTIYDSSHSIKRTFSEIRIFNEYFYEIWGLITQG